MSQNRGKQKRLEKHRQKRDLARRKEAAKTLSFPTSAGGLVRLAVTCPPGPSFVSAGWDDEETPSLVSVVVTRALADGTFLPAMALVDRTCLGVKNGYVGKPMTPSDLKSFLARVGDAHGGIEQVDLLVAQSIVFHAIDYAGSLGFEPHRDFSNELFGPRPDTLIVTPFAHSPKPLYVAGPSDVPGRVMAQLDAAVGRGAYDFTVPVGDTFYETVDVAELEEGDNSQWE